MSDRNWEAELAKIDKQLASISDEQLMATSAPAAPAAGAKAGGRLAAPSAAPKAIAAPAASGGALASGRPWVTWVKVLLAVGAAAGLMWWPWPARCGVPLWGFTAATGGVAALGIWSAIGTWRHRLGWAHLASLGVIAWGAALGAREVLPRVGYAIASEQRPAQWSCEGLPPVSTPAVTPPAGGAAVPDGTTLPPTTPP